MRFGKYTMRDVLETLWVVSLALYVCSAFAYANYMVCRQHPWAIAVPVALFVGAIIIKVYPRDSLLG